jgi:triosephosphate isomerase
VTLPLIGTSWKMHLTSTEAAAYIDTLVPLVDDVVDRSLFLLVPFTSIWVAQARLAGSRVAWGAQDVHAEDWGAHTGDVSAPMLADLGCTYVEVGHAERRRDYGETDALVAAKVEAIHRHGMTALVCVGESERLPLSVTMAQLAEQLRLLATRDLDRLVIAYEPVWAIGKGSRPAEPAWVGEIHRGIHDTLVASGGGGSTPVIYGGSVTPGSAEALLQEAGVDGLFVGRRALDPRVFAEIAHVPAKRRESGPASVPMAAVDQGGVQ